MTGEHSDAYERLVRDEDDVVGLLAYALYKRDKRELAVRGELGLERLREHHKTLTSGLVEQYKDAALRRLETYGQSILEAARPEIQEETRTNEIRVAKDETIAVVKSSTRWWLSILLNVVAWLISLAITFLVLTGTGRVNVGIAPT